MYAQSPDLRGLARAQAEHAVGWNLERVDERERDDEPGVRGGGRDSRQALAVEMVEVVVRDRDQIEAGRFVGRERRRHEPVRMRRQERVDEHSRAVEPEQKARLAEPAELDLAAHPRSFSAAARIESTTGA